MANAGGVTVIVDVLSFSTCVDVACARGSQILPFPWGHERAGEFARSRGAELAGSRSEAGPSLSPASLLDIDLGTRLVLPSPNGSTLALACRAPIVLAGCFRNAGAVAAYALRQNVPVTVIAAGERWEDGSLRPAIEDLLGAGAILAELEGVRSPEARVAVAAYESVRTSLAGVVRSSASGVELVERGFERDVEVAVALNASRCVPRLRGEAFEAVS